MPQRLPDALPLVTPNDAACFGVLPGETSFCTYVKPASTTPYSVTLLCAWAALANVAETAARIRIFFMMFQITCDY